MEHHCTAEGSNKFQYINVYMFDCSNRYHFEKIQALVSTIMKGWKALIESSPVKGRHFTENSELFFVTRK